MPTNSRLRPVQPLRGRDGSCLLVYDLERALLVAVPEDYRWHVAQALENGDLDGDLLGWLAGEDLLTWKGRPGADQTSWFASAAGRGRGARQEEIRCHPAEPSVQAVAIALDALIRRTEAGARIVLHLDAEGELGRPDAVRRAVTTARGVALATGRVVEFDLTTDGRGVGAPFARFLAEHGVTVRLTTQGPAFDLFLRELPERLTFCPVLDSGDRLLDCWRDARVRGVRRLAPVKVADRPLSGLALFEAELRQYRHDLFEVADDLFAALAAGDTPLPVHEPLARVVHRHVAGYPPPTGLAVAMPARTDVPEGGHLGSGGLADCSACWAADLCSRNVLARPRPGDRSPRADRCELWRAEVEVGLLLCHRLECLDPNLPAVLSDREDEPLFDAFTFPGTADLRTC